jgi:TatD DNase family protein
MIDTHCHLTDPQFQNDLTVVLERAQNAGVTAVINAGYDLATSRAAVEQRRLHDWLLPAVGIHPNEAAGAAIKEMARIEETLQKDKVYAIGETGLDYYRDFLPRDAQRELFVHHIRLARKYGLPLLIHTRNSIDDAVEIIQKEGYYKGVFHCFSGTQEQARRIINLGFYLGFGGVLTISKKIRQVFRVLPFERIVLETDAPFLPPQGHRGQRNEPAYIRETLRAASQVLSKPPEALEKIFDRNASQLFAI